MSEATITILAVGAVVLIALLIVYYGLVWRRRRGP
jgi:hypothetical protein